MQFNVSSKLFLLFLIVFISYLPNSHAKDIRVTDVFIEVNDKLSKSESWAVYAKIQHTQAWLTGVLCPEAVDESINSKLYNYLFKCLLKFRVPVTIESHAVGVELLSFDKMDNKIISLFTVTSSGILPPDKWKLSDLIGRYYGIKAGFEFIDLGQGVLAIKNADFFTPWKRADIFLGDLSSESSEYNLDENIFESFGGEVSITKYNIKLDEEIDPETIKDFRIIADPSKVIKENFNYIPRDHLNFYLPD